MLLGLDGDPEALDLARETLSPFGARAILVRSNFNQLAAVAAAYRFIPADGVLLDLGLSSMQLRNPARGFSFDSTSLDMRMDPDAELTAADLVNGLSERELADLIFNYGEEHFSRRIAKRIVEQRPIAGGAQLAEVVARAVGRAPGRGRIHPATKTFQALRIAVNRELENVESVLGQLAEVVGQSGRVAIITFHSLEDRLVKNFFKTNDRWRNLTKHPIKPEYAEVRSNPRARSAKLRVAERA